MIMKNSIATINVPVSTLNAIKNLLFSEKEGGVDLSSIVEDLTTGNENRDLMAINVGLTFKGIKPEIDSTTRYSRDYQCLVEYTFISYSMIRDVVSCTRKIIAKWNSEKNDLCPYVDNNPQTFTFSLNAWYNEYSKDRSEPTAEIIERFAKKEEPKPQTI